MPYEPEQLVEDLKSTEPARVAAALSALANWMKVLGYQAPVPRIGLELLAVFGPEPPEQVRRDFFHAVSDYDGFEPPFDEASRSQLLVALCLAYPSGYVAMQVGLWLKIRKAPEAAVALAMHQLVGLGLEGAQSVRGAHLLLSTLLDGSEEVRAATLAAMQRFPKSTAYTELLESLLP